MKSFVKKKILLIEDDDSIGNLVRDLLESRSMTVTWAKDGDEGLKKYKEEFFDILVVDVGLPKLTGFEVCKRIREEPFGFLVPLVFLTCFDSFPNKVEGLALGGDMYLTKPFHVEGLPEKLALLEEEKREKLTENPWTGLPSYIKLKAILEGPKAPEPLAAYTDIEDFFDNMPRFKYESMQLVKLFGNILREITGGKNLFHLDYSNFFFFIPQEGWEIRLKELLSRFDAAVQETFAGKVKKLALHQFAFDLSKNKWEIEGLRKRLLELKKKNRSQDHAIIPEWAS